MQKRYSTVAANDERLQEYEGKVSEFLARCASHVPLDLDKSSPVVFVRPELVCALELRVWRPEAAQLSHGLLVL